MRRACCLLMVLFVVCASGSGQSAPKLTSPKIVATFEQLGQTTRIPPTTIYTPKVWGTFRVSIVMVGTVPNGITGTRWEGDLLFSDGAGESLPNSFVATLNTDIRRTAVAEFPIRAKAGEPIKFQVKSFGAADSKYNVWVVVEQLM